MRDARGRRALEAFTALDLPALEAELSSYGRGLGNAGNRAWDEAAAATQLHPLRDFVLTFGPLGVDWGSRFRISDASLRRLLRGSQPSSTATEPSNVRSRGNATRFAIASFRGHGPGRLANPVVREGIAYPGLPHDERRYLDDDALAHDDWQAIDDATRDLRLTLAIADAVARGSAAATREAMLAFLKDENWEFDASPAGPWYTEYGAAITGYRPSDVFRPFRLPSHQVDWRALARRFLADLITRQIDFAVPLVQVDAAEEFAIRWRATAVLEVIYLQLLDHMTGRADFGIGTCKACRGAILRTRRPGPTEDQWHAGCRGGRVRAWRASKR